jgi:hypothetical protein
VTPRLLRTPASTPEATAAELGFLRRAHGGWRRNGFELEQAGAWLVLRRPQRFDGDPLRDVFGTPGLWRALPSRKEPEEWDLVFELPALQGTSGEEIAEDAARSVPVTTHPCAPLVAWAESLERGDAASPAPSADEVEAWLPLAQRHVRRGGQLARIEPVLEGARFGLAIPELARVPEALAPAREAWLAEICVATQVQWRLVRVGFDRDRVRAEVDLSGAPQAVCPTLFQLALAALRCSAAWVLPALKFITDPQASSEAVDHNPRRTDSRLEERGTA